MGDDMKNKSKLGGLLEFIEATEGADFQKWECTRGLNNRGKIIVFKVGRIYYRQDKTCRVTKVSLLRDGWKPDGRVVVGRGNWAR
jgi:hypothetical protein